MKSFLPVVLIALFLFCVRYKENKTENFAFNTYVNSATKGYVSKAAPVAVYFNKQLMNVVVGQELSSDIFEMSPKVKGNLYVVSRKKIIFKPDAMLKAATKYEATLRLDKLFENFQRTQRIHIQLSNDSSKFYSFSAGITIL